jgi:hypothetical protein
VVPAPYFNHIVVKKSNSVKRSHLINYRPNFNTCGSLYFLEASSDWFSSSYINPYPKEGSIICSLKSPNCITFRAPCMRVRAFSTLGNGVGYLSAVGGQEYPDLLTYEPLRLQLRPAQHLARLFINEWSVLAPKCSIGWAALVTCQDLLISDFNEECSKENEEY